MTVAQVQALVKQVLHVQCMCNGSVHAVYIKVHVPCVRIIYVLSYHDYMLELPAVAVNTFFICGRSVRERFADILVEV